MFLVEFFFILMENNSFGDLFGLELELVARTVEMDPLEDVATRQIRARLWRKGKLLKEEVHTQGKNICGQRCRLPRRYLVYR